MTHTSVKYNVSIVSMLLVVAITVLIAVLVIRLVPTLRAFIYDAFMQRELRSTIAATSDWQSMSGAHVEVRYEEDREVASIVLEAAEEQFMRVMADFRFTPKTKVTVLVYQSREELRDEFGWNSQDDASGVYWGGVIRVLSPRAYMDNTSHQAMAEEFNSAGPLTHEFTHYVLDHIAHGNYPRWLSEGLAQYEEYNILGYMWANPGPLTPEDYYAYRDLDSKFEGLDDQAIAYSQAYLMTDYLISKNGWAGMTQLIEDLGAGRGFGEALRRAYGLDVASLESQWLESQQHAQR